MSNKILKLEIKGLSSVDSVIWISMPSIEDLRTGDQIILVDTDDQCIRGANILNILPEKKKIKVSCVFRID